MSYKEITLNRPNFLGSEVGLLTKTITVPATASYVVEDKRHIVRAGTIFTTPYKGILFVDVDITDGEAVAPLMVGGYYIDAKLPASAVSYVSDFAAQGLFPIVEGAVVRPDYGTVDEPSKLTAPTISVSGKVISITSVTNAIKYDVYKSDTASGLYSKVASVSKSASPSYTASALGYYKVKAIGDHLFYADSDLSTAVQVQSLT